MRALNDLSCTLYVTTELGLDELAAAVAGALSATATGPAFAQTIQTAAGEIEVRPNSEWDAALAKQFPDGFLFFPYRLEYYPEAGASREDQIALVSSSLTALWSQGIAVVAVCDYEDELPRNGGYHDRSVPWPFGHGSPTDGRDVSSLPLPGAVEP